MSTVTFTGNLAADPELTFLLAVIENRRRRNESTGEWGDAEPNRCRVEAWAGLAENAAESLCTGDRVLVTGVIVTDRWSDKETGESRTAQHVKAAEIGYSLKYHTVSATKASRTSKPDTAEADGE